MKNPAEITRIIFSISILVLSASIAYFTYEVSRVRTDLPELLGQLNKTATIIEPVIAQMDSINQLVPPILEEVRQTRELIPPIVDEVAQIRKKIPAILHEVEETRKMVPAVLTEVEQTRKLIPGVLAEVKQTRKQIPPILKEVKATRESLPGLIDDANKLVDKARVAGREASSGAVTGFFSGIFSAPFAIVGDIGSTVFGMDQKVKNEYSQDDLNDVYQAALVLLESDKVGTKSEITSKDGTIKTTITITNIDDSGEFLCKSVHFHSTKNNKVISDKETTICQNKDGKWEKND